MNKSFATLSLLLAIVLVLAVACTVRFIASQSPVVRSDLSFRDWSDRASSASSNFGPSLQQQWGPPGSTSLMLLLLTWLLTARVASLGSWRRYRSRLTLA